MYSALSVDFKDVKELQAKCDSGRLSLGGWVVDSQNNTGAHVEIDAYLTYDQLKFLHAIIGDALLPKLPHPVANCQKETLVIEKIPTFPRDEHGLDVLAENVLGKVVNQ